MFRLLSRFGAEVEKSLPRSVLVTVSRKGKDEQPQNADFLAELQGGLYTGSTKLEDLEAHLRQFVKAVEKKGAMGFPTLTGMGIAMARSGFAVVYFFPSSSSELPGVSGDMKDASVELAAQFKREKSLNFFYSTPEQHATLRRQLGIGGCDSTAAAAVVAIKAKRNKFRVLWSQEEDGEVDLKKHLSSKLDLLLSGSMSLAKAPEDLYFSADTAEEKCENPANQEEQQSSA